MENYIKNKKDTQNKKDNPPEDNINKYSKSEDKSSHLSTADSMNFTFDMTQHSENLEIPPNTPAFDKEKETDYQCISYMTSRRKPDIYLGDQVITAKNYKVINNITEENIILAEGDDEVVVIKDNEEDNKSESASEDNQDYKDMMRKEIRYFSSGNITIKCYNCNEVGHMSRNCPNEFIINCHRCQQRGHYEYECPNIKCFKCNRIGHKSFECKVNSKDIVKCQNCENVGHELEDCLIKPMRIRSRDLKNSECFHCHKLGHLICPFKENVYIIEDYHSDEVNVTDSEEEEEYNSEDDFNKILNKAVKKEQIEKNFKNIKNLSKRKRHRIFNKIDNRDIKDTLFCPKCAGMHEIADCSVQLRFNSFDNLRKSYSRTFNYKRETQVKSYNNYYNDDKYNKKNLYDDGLPSDESFSQVIKNEKRVSRKENNEKIVNNPFKKIFNKKDSDEEMSHFVEDDHPSEDDHSGMDYFEDYERGSSRNNKNKNKKQKVETYYNFKNSYQNSKSNTGNKSYKNNYSNKNNNNNFGKNKIMSNDFVRNKNFIKF